jgi:hypothetical protein
MKTWKHTFILLFYLYNTLSLWLNISCLQTVKGGRHLEISTWQDYRTHMVLVIDMKTWKYACLLTSLYNCYLNLNQYQLLTTQRRKTTKFSNWQDHRTSMEPRTGSMKTWKYAFLLTSLHIVILNLNQHQFLTNPQRRKAIEISNWQDPRTCMKHWNKK